MNRNDYMRDYMRKRRVEQPASQKGRMRLQLERIIDKLEGNDKPLAAEIRALAQEGLR